MNTRDKKIVFFVGALREGGAERVISILSNKLVENGKNVQILLYYDSEVFYRINPKIKIIKVEKETGSRNLLKNLLWIRKYLLENAEIVLSFLAVFNMIALTATMFSKVPVIVADRNDPRHVPENKCVRFLRDFLYRFADGVVVQTRHNQNHFPQKIQDNSVIIFNPIDLGENAGRALVTEKRKEIVSVGRLMPQKNQKMLIEAFACIHAKFPEYRMVIYGEGPCREELENQIRELGLQDHILLPGSVKDLHDRIVCAELFVLSSNYEGMRSKLRGTLRRRIIYHLGYVLGPTNDYECVKSLYKSKNLKEAYAYYSYPIAFRDESLSQNWIMVGHSAHPSSQHIKTYELLAQYPLSGDSVVYSNLSYGYSDKQHGMSAAEYIQQVSDKGRELFGDKYLPDLEFCGYDAYVKKLMQIKVVIFNNNRGQGFSNIANMLHLGIKIYMNPQNELYTYFRKLGAIMYTMDDLDASFEQPLSPQEQKHNMEVIEKLFSNEEFNRVWMKAMHD